MNITFKHEEIVQAIVNYTQSRGIDLKKSLIEVNLTAGRGGNGYTAQVEILDNNVASLEDANNATVTSIVQEESDTIDESMTDDTKSVFEN